MCAIWSIVQLRVKIQVAQETKIAIMAEVAVLDEENARLTYLLNNKDNPEVKAEIARTELGMQLPGEKTFRD
ncbi:MAG: septum formation initiator family protein [Oscillospiraceae bacterium]|nr:septum formation initiator family protein [Oscillospiraceae bacterium]